MATGSVGAPRPVHGRGVAGEAANSVFQNLLDGEAVGLPLPADERAAVVFDGQVITGHV